MGFKKENLVLDKARKDCLIITADFHNDDIGVLLVARSSDGSNFEIVNQFSGDKAINLYNKLVKR